jgi:hypothetical protein
MYQPPARIAHEARRDQDQAIEIPGFPAWETGDSRTAKTDRQGFPGIGGGLAEGVCQTRGWNM